MGKIQFRCWYCNRNYLVLATRIGQVIHCGCERKLRVPSKSGGNCRHRTLTDWIVEAVVYGGGGALLGLSLAIVLYTRVGAFGVRGNRGMVFLGFIVVGFLLGMFGGEAGVNWVGRLIRERSER